MGSKQRAVSPGGHARAILSGNCRENSAEAAAAGFAARCRVLFHNEVRTSVVATPAVRRQRS